jgi:hypothetical protein
MIEKKYFMNKEIMFKLKLKSRNFFNMSKS